MKQVKVQMKKVKKETQKAWGFDIGGTKQYTIKRGKVTEVITEPVLTWFPKSKCSFDGEYMIMPEWLAKKTGCIIAIEHGMGEYL